MRGVAIAAYVVLSLSLAWNTAPQLVALAREAWHLRGMSYKQRRSAVMGAFYDRARAIDGSLPRNEPVAVVINAIRDVDGAVLFNYYLYPRVTRIYPTLAFYRNTPGHPSEIVYFDGRHGAEPRRMTYGEIRAEQMGSDFVSGRLEPDAAARRELVIPVVASLDGPVDTYTTEAAIENAGASEAILSLTFYPSPRTRKIAVPAGARLTWNDFVYQNFGAMGFGWLRVSSDQPLRWRFLFVNRTAESAEEVPAVANEAATSLHLAAPSGARLWLVNFGDGDVGVRLNGGATLLAPPYGMRDFAAEPDMHLQSDRPFFAFASWRDADGRSRFAWPEER